MINYRFLNLPKNPLIKTSYVQQTLETTATTTNSYLSGNGMCCFENIEDFILPSVLETFQQLGLRPSFFASCASITVFLNTNKKLIIINDLVKYPIPKHDNIIEFNMERFFNIKSFCSIVHNSKIFLTPSTSPLDLAAYYCNTHIVCLDDKQNKCDFVNKVLNTKNKTAISYNMISGDFDKLERFIVEH
jgi:hypothetical protein